jgi:hypothetical protein
LSKAQMALRPGSERSYGIRPGRIHVRTVKLV